MTLKFLMSCSLRLKVSDFLENCFRSFLGSSCVWFWWSFAKFDNSEQPALLLWLEYLQYVFVSSYRYSQMADSSLCTHGE